MVVVLYLSLSPAKPKGWAGPQIINEAGYPPLLGEAASVQFGVVSKSHITVRGSGAGFGDNNNVLPRFC